MQKKTIVTLLAAIAVVAGLGMGLAMAQNMGGGGGGRNWDPAQIRQRAAERVKETLAPSDEEWTVIEPKLNKVLEASAEVSSGMRSMRRGGPGGGDATPAPEPTTATGKAAQDLQATLDKADATPEEIKAKLTALREAREKAKQELETAKTALRELLNVKQEAQLVLMGTLD